MKRILLVCLTLLSVAAFAQNDFKRLTVRDRFFLYPSANDSGKFCMFSANGEIVAATVTQGSGGGGSSTYGQSLGSGYPVFAYKADSTLYFRSLIPGTDILFDSNSVSITPRVGPNIPRLNTANTYSDAQTAQILAFGSATTALSGINARITGTAYGVYGQSNATSGFAAAVYGNSLAAGYGVYGASNGGPGGYFASAGGSPLIAGNSGGALFTVGQTSMLSILPYTVNVNNGGTAFTVNQTGSGDVFDVKAGGIIYFKVLPTGTVNIIGPLDFADLVIDPATDSLATRAYARLVASQVFHDSTVYPDTAGLGLILAQGHIAAMKLNATGDTASVFDASLGLSYPTQTGNYGKVLQTNGTSVSWANTQSTDSLRHYFFDVTGLGAGKVPIFNGTNWVLIDTALIGGSGGGGSTSWGAITGTLFNQTDLRDTILTRLRDFLPTGYIYVGDVSNKSAGVLPSGDVTISSSGVTSIGANKVTLGQMATVGTGVVLGRRSAGTGNVESISNANLKSDLALNLVENTAVSTWVGSSNITTLGTVTAGTWHATKIDIAYGGTGQTTAVAALNALLPSQTGNNGKVLQTDGTNTSWQAISGTGTVTSVGLALPAEFTVTNSPVTSAGTLTGTWANVASGAVLMRAVGTSGVPSFQVPTYGSFPFLADTLALYARKSFLSFNNILTGTSGVALRVGNGGSLLLQGTGIIQANMIGNRMLDTSAIAPGFIVYYNGTNLAYRAPDSAGLGAALAAKQDKATLNGIIHAVLDSNKTKLETGSGYALGLMNGAADSLYRALLGGTMALTNKTVNVDTGAGKIATKGNLLDYLPKTTVQQFNFTVLDTVKTGGEVVWAVKVPENITITQVAAFTNANTVTFNLEERGSTTPNTTGTNVLTSSLVADNNEEKSTTFSNADIAGANYLVAVVSAAGDVSMFSCTIWYTIN